MIPIARKNKWGLGMDLYISRLIITSSTVDQIAAHLMCMNTLGFHHH